MLHKCEVFLQNYTTLLSRRGSTKGFFVSIVCHVDYCVQWITRSSRTSTVRWHSLTQSSRLFIGRWIDRTCGVLAVAWVTQVVLIPTLVLSKEHVWVVILCKPQLTAVTFCAGASWSYLLWFCVQNVTFYTERGICVRSCPLGDLTAGALDIGTGTHSWLYQ